MINKKCQDILKLLARSRNVLLLGQPGCGKSKLLSEVATAFVELSSTALDPQKINFPFPANANDFPLPDRTDRKVFRTVFHQNSKYRDFVSGISPDLDNTTSQTAFTVVSGTLFRASEHAKTENGASLLIIDEINRGPAVQVFGGAIVAIESDKRLKPDGTPKPETQFFELLHPEKKKIEEYALPHHLYILAAMNQADASVEPLDVAFLRRWEPFRLDPEEGVLREYYGIPDNSQKELPEHPNSVEDVWEASVRAWMAINKRISLGRGIDYQIGHGVLMTADETEVSSIKEVPAAKEMLCVGWAKIRSHVEEVFFGDIRGLAAVFNASNSEGNTSNPFKMITSSFAGDFRDELQAPTNFKTENIYNALWAFAKE